MESSRAAPVVVVVAAAAVAGEEEPIVLLLSSLLHFSLAAAGASLTLLSFVKGFTFVPCTVMGCEKCLRIRIPDV